LVATEESATKSLFVEATGASLIGDHAISVRERILHDNALPVRISGELCRALSANVHVRDVNIQWLILVVSCLIVGEQYGLGSRNLVKIEGRILQLAVHVLVVSGYLPIKVSFRANNYLIQIARVVIAIQGSYGGALEKLLHPLKLWPISLAASFPTTLERISNLD
jgi:hypothetical protein